MFSSTLRTCGIFCFVYISGPHIVRRSQPHKLVFCQLLRVLHLLPEIRAEPHNHSSFCHNLTLTCRIQSCYDYYNYSSAFSDMCHCFIKRILLTTWFTKKQLSVHVYHVRLHFALDKLNNRNDLSYTEYSLVIHAEHVVHSAWILFWLWMYVCLYVCMYVC